MPNPLSLSAIHSLIAKNANQLIVLSDKDGKVLFVNDSFKKITGHDLRLGDFLRDIPFSSFMRKEDKESISLLYKSSLIGKKKSFSFISR